MIKLTTLLSVLLLCSCRLLPEQALVDLYQLPPPAINPSTSPTQLEALRIARPLTNEALGGNRLLIVTENNRLQAFAQTRLASPAPLVWRDWLLDAFWRDGRVAALSAASEGLRSELELGGMLRSFHIDASGARPEAVILFDATLMRTTDRSVIASRRFESRYPADALTAADAIGALGSAASQLARELVDWTVSLSSS